MTGQMPTKKRLPLALLIGLLMLLAGGLIYIGVRQPAGPARKGAVVGGPAPDFVLPDRAGRQISLKQLRGRKVLLAFWASWCPPCRTEMESLQRLQDNPALDNFTVLAVNAGEPREVVGDFLARQDLSLPVLFDEDGSAQQAYGVYQLPVAFLVDGAGRIVARHFGLRDWNSAEAVSEINRIAKD